MTYNDHPPIRVHLLGGLRVLRSDGSAVPVSEWRTGKTMDLLRLLALENGRPVRPSSLIEKLWPDATPDHARGSLRTAASMIRRAVDPNCVQRHPEGLVLQNAWVDTIEFLTVVHLMQLAASTGQHSHVMALARSAESLYADDFHAYDDDSLWAQAERNHLIRTRHEMLFHAAESALQLGHFREALRLSTAAVRLDPTSEAAHRSQMRAYAELGEVGSALRVFETYRSNLAKELGAEPSPQTRDLHLQLLRAARG
jgi:DNA-binding SARP family transcriptional activator